MSQVRTVPAQYKTDHGLAEQVAASLLAEYGESIIREALDLGSKAPWPEVGRYRNSETGKIYVPHHDREAMAVFQDTPRHVLKKGGEGGGKALALDTPLPTPTGWTTMADVQPGDWLLDSHKDPCQVLWVSDVMTGHPCYKVSFAGEPPIIADAEHLWPTLEGNVTTQQIHDAPLAALHLIPCPYANGRLIWIRWAHEHESVPVKCVGVDSPDHLYLAGPGMIPTHNSVAGTIKTLGRVRRGMNGVMCSPDLQHFKKSLWPEFRRWCPWGCTLSQHRERYTRPSWEPQEAFPIIFLNARGGFSTLYCGGAKETEMEAWEGPNINFAYGDELKRHKSAVWLKTFSGRVRIPGPLGEPPQLWITTTPRKHWLWEYFGPVQATCPDCEEIEIDTPGGKSWACPICGRTEDLEIRDDWYSFKQEAMTVTLLTAENAANLSKGYVDQRRMTLSEKEARVYLEAAWEDLEGGEKYLQSMTWWDSCMEVLPPLGTREKLVLAMDAATGRKEGISDTFGIVGLTAHPDPARGRGKNKDLAVRFVRAWSAQAGQKINFQGTEADPGPERIIRQLCKRYRVVCIAYDPYQLHDLAMRLTGERIGWFFEFGQGVRRIEADTDLVRLIQEGHIAHDGHRLLRSHLDNADRHLDEGGKRMRIVKRQDRLKIDLAVCLSMGVHRARELNV